MDPVQEEKAQETFEKLYRKMEKNEEHENLTVTELTRRTLVSGSHPQKCETPDSEAVIVPNNLVPDTQVDDILKSNIKEKNINEPKLEDISQPINVDSRHGPSLPPLEDPSVILLSPTLERSEKVQHSEQEIETLADEVKHIKEDKAAEFLKEELKDKVVDMIAYQKHNVNEEEKLGQGSSANHFLELREKEIEAQKDFHKKLLNELTKDPVQYKSSAVAEALGTKFQVKTSQSSHKIEEQQYVQEQGSLSVPSKSPELSRRGSQSDTYMSKGAFWSHSLPRSRRRVTFTDELPPPPPPTRPPPPAPVRQQSIHAMKDLSTFSNTYNNVLQEKKQQMIPETENGVNVDQKATCAMTNNITSTQGSELRSYSRSRNVMTENDHKVDMGTQRDPWADFYGKCVMNNTLQDRLERRGLQKSQSAVWANNELVEHGPVLSTDKLEKPKKVANGPVTSESCQGSTTSLTLPRSSSSTRSFPSFNGSLRRNTSLSNLNGANPAAQPASDASFHIPPSVVRGIVITVLQNQGITNPTEEILQKAIEEYYSKNPQGVSRAYCMSGLQTIIGMFYSSDFSFAFFLLGFPKKIAILKSAVHPLCISYVTPEKGMTVVRPLTYHVEASNFLSNQ